MTNAEIYLIRNGQQVQPGLLHVAHTLLADPGAIAPPQDGAIRVFEGASTLGHVLTLDKWHTGDIRDQDSWQAKLWPNVGTLQTLHVSIGGMTLNLRAMSEQVYRNQPPMMRGALEGSLLQADINPDNFTAQQLTFGGRELFRADLLVQAKTVLERLTEKSGAELRLLPERAG